jgi:small subunit ribosomal protein S5
MASEEKKDIKPDEPSIETEALKEAEPVKAGKDVESPGGAEKTAETTGSDEAVESDEEAKKEVRAFFKPSRGKKVESEFVERVIKISRVSKVVKGGKNFSFSALVVTGDGKGQVGIGLGKSNEVVEAIKKGTAAANKSFVKVSMAGDTIPYEVIGKFKASRVMMKPAGPGTGVIAGGPVRAMCDAVGIKNILTKTLGSRNAVNVVKAAEDGFKQLRLERKGLNVEVGSEKHGS